MDECGMDPDEIGLELDDSIKGLEKTITGITWKADHPRDQTYYSPLVEINFYALTYPKKTRILHVYRMEGLDAEKINNNRG